jgi:hypothetical protein
MTREVPLFVGEFAPPEEKPKARVRAKLRQRSLFRAKKLRRGDFPAFGLNRFDNINAWLTKVQRFVERGYVIEYGHQGGRDGWARVVDVRKHGRGGLISKAIAPTFAKPEPVQGELPGEPIFRGGENSPV